MKVARKDVGKRSIVLGIMLILSLVVPVSFADPPSIVVTTLQDTADAPFSVPTPLFCGTGTVSDLPGADGEISLREAIIAANNTPGAQTITFASNLSGGTIALTAPLPPLCGGNTTVNGDLNGDGIPNITLNGFALPTGPGTNVITIIL